MSKLAPVTLTVEALLESMLTAPVTSMSKPLPPLTSMSNPPVLANVLPVNLTPSTVTCPLVLLIVSPVAPPPVCVIVLLPVSPMTILPNSKLALVEPSVPNAVVVSAGSVVNPLKSLNIPSEASLYKPANLCVPPSPNCP